MDDCFIGGFAYVWLVGFYIITIRKKEKKHDDNDDGTDLFFFGMVLIPIAHFSPSFTGNDPLELSYTM
jgi:hypothetical protein